MVVAKIIMNNGDGQLKNLICCLSDFYISSNEEIVKKVQEHHKYEELSTYLEMLNYVRFAFGIPESKAKQIDYIIDLSNLTKELNFDTFHKKSKSMIE